jgi:hypothetical protein
MKLSKRSKRHVECIECLKKLFPAIKILEEYKIGNNQFIDIYLPAYYIGIEIDGEQHDSYIPFFHGEDESGFRLQNFLDGKKELLCKEKGIFLYRVKSDDTRTMEGIVMEALALFVDAGLQYVEKEISDTKKWASVWHGKRRTNK